MKIWATILHFFGFSKKKSISTEKAVPRDDYAYNEQRKIKEEEMNRILDKIADNGLASLTKKEKAFLDSESKKG